jgi:hypothetical protein
MRDAGIADAFPATSTMSPEREPPASSGGDAQPRSGKGFRGHKRQDHALLLIEELRESLGDLARVRRLLLELGRFYDPVLGGNIMELPHQKQIVAALEAGRTGDAEALIDARYALYIKDRIHLGRGEE